jgi:hypothetical protein
VVCAGQVISPAFSARLISCIDRQGRPFQHIVLRDDEGPDMPGGPEVERRWFRRGVSSELTYHNGPPTIWIDFC